MEHEDVLLLQALALTLPLLGCPALIVAELIVAARACTVAGRSASAGAGPRLSWPSSV